MYRRRLERAALIIDDLIARGVCDILYPGLGDQLLGWGSVIPELPEDCQAHDLRCWVVRDPDFREAGLTDGWGDIVPGITLGITHLANFFDISERDAFFIFGPLETPVLSHARARIEALLNVSSVMEREALSEAQQAKIAFFQGVPLSVTPRKFTHAFNKQRPTVHTASRVRQNLHRAGAR